MVLRAAWVGLLIAAAGNVWAMSVLPIAATANDELAKLDSIDRLVELVVAQGKKDKADLYNWQFTAKLVELAEDGDLERLSRDADPGVRVLALHAAREALDKDWVAARARELLSDAALIGKSCETVADRVLSMLMEDGTEASKALADDPKIRANLNQHIDPELFCAARVADPSGKSIAAAVAALEILQGVDGHPNATTPAEDPLVKTLLVGDDLTALRGALQSGSVLARLAAIQRLVELESGAALLDDALSAVAAGGELHDYSGCLGYTIELPTPIFRLVTPRLGAAEQSALLRGMDADGQAQVIMEIVRGDDALIENLKDVLRELAAAGRAEAIDLLGRLGSDQDLSTLVNAFRRDPWVHIRGLRSIPVTEAEPLLTKLWHDQARLVDCTPACLVSLGKVTDYDGQERHCSADCKASYQRNWREFYAVALGYGGSVGRRLALLPLSEELAGDDKRRHLEALFEAFGYGSGIKGLALELRTELWREHAYIGWEELEKLIESDPVAGRAASRRVLQNIEAIEDMKFHRVMEYAGLEDDSTYLGLTFRAAIEALDAAADPELDALLLAGVRQASSCCLDEFSDAAAERGLRAALPDLLARVGPNARDHELLAIAYAVAVFADADAHAEFLGLWHAIAPQRSAELGAKIAETLARDRTSAE